MDDQQTRDQIEKHADAVVSGDMDTAVADFTEDVRPHVGHIGRALPRPVTSAEILSIDEGDDETVATIRYSGDSSEVTIRSHWQDQDGRPMIVRAELAE
jgi:hypothetical protein